MLSTHNFYPARITLDVHLDLVEKALECARDYILRENWQASAEAIEIIATHSKQAEEICRNLTTKS